MKNLTHLIICLATLTATSAFGQDAKAKVETHPDMAAQITAVQPASPHLTKFDLDFPGGTPGELVAAIQKAMGRPLNAIVPVGYASFQLPPLKMNGVDVPQLFQALEQASLHQVSMPFGQSIITRSLQYGFRTTNRDPRTQSDDTIWSFYEQGNESEPVVSRFYLLTPYLDAGLTVDDITTAIQTDWRLRGDATTPKLSFHKETKLLIAVGQSGDLDTIDAVLKALGGASAKSTTDNAPAEAKTKP